MALAADVVWEVRTDGDDNNGGGFNSSSSGTDYSQQAAAQLTVTDAATSAVGSTTLTSTTGGFTSAMVGNVVHLYSGTNLTDGWYEITGFTDTNTVTLDRAPDDGVGGVSGATCKVGGALASPGGLGATLANAGAGGNKCWIRGGTYTITSWTQNVSGGRFYASGIRPLTVSGYGTTRGDGQRPVVDVPIGFSPGYSDPVFNMTSNSYAEPVVFRHLEVTFDPAYSDGVGLRSAGYVVLMYDCVGRGGYSAIYASANVSHCLADGCRYGFIGVICDHCKAVNCSVHGFKSSACVHCLADSCNVGFYQEYGDMIMNCVAYNSVSDGFQQPSSYRQASFLNSIAVNNGGYGFNIAERSVIVNCAAYGNSSGGFPVTPDPDDTITITADPFVDSAGGDFRLNDTAGAGAVLRGAGIGVYGQTDNKDVGAVQHSDAIKVISGGGCARLGY